MNDPPNVVHGSWRFSDALPSPKVEYRLASSLPDFMPNIVIVKGDVTVRRNLDGNRFTQIEKQYKRDDDAARSLFNYLNVSDILRLAVKAGTIQVDDHVIKAIKEARDGAAHASENIVTHHVAVKNLATVKREALRILGGA